MAKKTIMESVEQFVVGTMDPAMGTRKSKAVKKKAAKKTKTKKTTAKKTKAKKIKTKKR